MTLPLRAAEVTPGERAGHLEPRVEREPLGPVVRRCATPCSADPVWMTADTDRGDDAADPERRGPVGPQPVRLPGSTLDRSAIERRSPTTWNPNHRSAALWATASTARPPAVCTGTLTATSTGGPPARVRRRSGHTSTLPARPLRSSSILTIALARLSATLAGVGLSLVFPFYGVKDPPGALDRS